MFQSESSLNSCLNIKELLARNRCDIWRLRDNNGTRTHNLLIRKRTLNQLAKLTKWLSCVVNTYLYVAFDCMFLSCDVRLSSESTLCSCLKVKELPARNRHDIWTISDIWYRSCFEQEVPWHWHSGNCRVWIHSETRTWHGKNIQSKAPYR